MVGERGDAGERVSRRQLLVLLGVGGSMASIAVYTWDDDSEGGLLPELGGFGRTDVGFGNGGYGTGEYGT